MGQRDPMALFEPARHEPLIDAPWDAGAARRAMEAIVADTHAAYLGPEGLWLIHPLDVSAERPEVLKLLYYGAAGVIWGLDYLAAQGATPPTKDYRAALETLPDRAFDDSMRLKGPVSAFHMGLAGIVLTQLKLGPVKDSERGLSISIRTHIGLDRTEGLTWGVAGSLLATRFMLERTAEPRWRTMALTIADGLWERWRWDDVARCDLWEQDLYGDKAKQLGALHGFAGNAFALLSIRHLLPQTRQAELVRRIRQTLAATALRDDGLVNWPFEAGGSSHPGSAAIRLQHCMGAPGIINVLSGLPPDPETDALLLGGGELTWTAGPPAKPPCLCHGAPGNGYAFLKLFARTGDELWLARARRFAMHAIAQNEAFTAQYGRRKHSLWTGDLGLAIYLWACIAADPAFPTLDVF